MSNRPVHFSGVSLSSTAGCCLVSDDTFPGIPASLPSLPFSSPLCCFLRELSSHSRLLCTQPSLNPPKAPCCLLPPSSKGPRGAHQCGATIFILLRGTQISRAEEHIYYITARHKPKQARRWALKHSNSRELFWA